MSKSDTVRKRLDERGIEHKDNDTPINGVKSYMTTWHCTNGNLVSFIETEIPHATKLRIYNPTPEQAIAATLGRTAQIVKVPRHSHVALGHYECGGCGQTIDAGDNFCRRCGVGLEGAEE